MTRPRQSLEDIIELFRPEDSLAVPLATGQPQALLQGLGKRQDWKRLEIFCGLLTAPYPVLANPHVFVTSGYYGPVERHFNEAGAHVEYLPSNFRGFEIYQARRPSRITAAVLSPPDEDGFCTFGTHGAAVFQPFRAACKNPDLLAIGEIHPGMPRVYGLEEYGDNKVHIDEVDHVYEADYPQASPPPVTPDSEEVAIVDHVLGLIGEKATLQLGIGAVPDLVATRLAEGSLGEFGIHSELIADGFLRLWEAGKISNQHKGIFPEVSIFTFAFGSPDLYALLDETKGQNRRQILCLPVGAVNAPHLVACNPNFISLNSGLMVDFAGQVSSEAIGLRQYSGVGGQLSFVQGAYQSPGGKTILCIKSTATVEGKKISNIVPVLPPGSLVSTPRHFTQYIVTEHGVADLYGVSDEKRAEKLIAIAHPDFREELGREFETMRRKYYKN